MASTKDSHWHVRTALALLTLALLALLGAVVFPVSSEARRIVGNNGANTLRGTSGKDLLSGRGGNDRLIARGGNDRLLGGRGNDRLFGGSGKDRLYGNSGKDRLYGNSGSDRLYGGSGKDRLYGGSGNDRLVGGSSADRISGGPGRDSAIASSADRVASDVEVVNGKAVSGPTGPTANRPPAFPSPMNETVTERFQYDPSTGYLTAVITTITVLTPATDPDGDALTYSWTATNGSITGNGLTATWTHPIVMGSPASGTATITVTDGKGGSDSFHYIYE
jgi:hypothetical protein